MPDMLTVIFWLVVAVYLWYAGSYLHRVHVEARDERYRQNQANSEMESL